MKTQKIKPPKGHKILEEGTILKENDLYYATESDLWTLTEFPGGLALKNSYARPIKTKKGKTK